MRIVVSHHLCILHCIFTATHVNTTCHVSLQSTNSSPKLLSNKQGYQVKCYFAPYRVWINAQKFFSTPASSKTFLSFLLLDLHPCQASDLLKGYNILKRRRGAHSPKNLAFQWFDWHELKSLAFLSQTEKGVVSLLYEPFQLVILQS